MGDKWSLLRIFYKDGTSRSEEIDDVDFWTTAPKKDIVGLKIERIESGGHYGIINTSEHNFQFFSYMKKKIIIGAGMDDIKSSHGMGMIINSNGDYHGTEIEENGRIHKFKGNVVDEGRNLELHGIKLEEIY